MAQKNKHDIPKQLQKCNKSITGDEGISLRVKGVER
jgi:hypothetical protein